MPEFKFTSWIVFLIKSVISSLY